MTDSGVQLSSFYRVQPVGLSRNAAVNTALPRAEETSTSLLRVRRCLFGAPRQGEIKELLLEETLQKRLHVLQKYGYDILGNDSISSNRCSGSDDVGGVTASTETKHSASSLSLIEKEMLAHKERLDEEKCTLSRASQCISSMSCNNESRTAGKLSKTTIGTVADSAIVSPVVPPSLGNERLKPYTRHALLSECCSLRNTIKTNTGNSSRTAITTVAGILQPQQSEVLQLPKSIRANVSSISSSATLAEPLEENDISLSVVAATHSRCN